jgi:hypothetical protein
VKTAQQCVDHWKTTNQLWRTKCLRTAAQECGLKAKNNFLKRAGSSFLRRLARGAGSPLQKAASAQLFAHGLFAIFLCAFFFAFLSAFGHPVRNY